MTPTVAILGAGGEIGGEVLGRLARGAESRPLTLRLGGRTLASLDRALAHHASATPALADTRVVPTDLWDDASLAAFVRGADVVVNCAGPTYRIRGRVAVAALRAGADYVDVGGDDPAKEQIEAGGVRGDARALLSAGTVPGLSALLPAWLARTCGAGDVAVTAWAGGMERCTRTVAEDMVLSLSAGGPGGAAYGTPLAVWRDHRPVPRAEAVRRNARLDGFPGEVAMQPLLSAETERLACTAGLRDVTWWNVWPEGQVWSLLSGLPSLLADPATSTDAVIERMCRAAAVDLVGHATWYRLRVRADGSLGVRTLDLSSASSALLTATMAATAVEHLLDVSTGGPAGDSVDGPARVRFAAQVVDPDRVIAALRSDPRIRLELRDETADADLGVALEEGEL